MRKIALMLIANLTLLFATADLQKTKTLDKDFNNDGLKDKIVIEDKNNSVWLKIFINKGHDKYEKVFESDKVIPKVEMFPNNSSMLRDGFDVDIIPRNELYLEKSEGASFHIEGSDKNALVLISRKEGVLNGFRLYFMYDAKDKQFRLENVYLYNFNDRDGYDLLSIYKIPINSHIKRKLKNFNGAEVHSYLYSKFELYRSQNISTKLLSKEFLQEYNELFTLYKNRSKKFKAYTNDLISKEETKYSLIEKYFFTTDIELSNNIAFFFEKTGHWQEAIYLLQKILADSYKHTVAYYNLGDAYWALGQKEYALESYTSYVTRMRQEGKEHTIPSKILKRTHQKKIASYIGKNETFLKIEYGDLNRDGIDDAVLVTEKKNGNRPLYILLGTKKGTYKVYGKNENIVYRAEAGGARGDPFCGITIKNGYFSIGHNGGSRWMWTVIITFKYDAKKRKFFLHKEGGSDADTRSSDGEVSVVERRVSTVKDFGVVPFEKYNNHMNEEYGVK